MTKKTFDCVAMKREIQERQRKRLKGLSPIEESRFIQAEIVRDPALVRLWKTAKRTSVGKTLGKERAS
jgi:hypothetical protein